MPKLHEQTHALLELMVRKWVQHTGIGGDVAIDEDAAVEATMELILKGWAVIVYDKQTEDGFEGLRVELVERLQ